MGLTHTPETWKRIKEARNAASRAAHTSSSYERATATRQRTYRKEMYRLLGGQRKETNITISVLSHKYRRRMTMLCYQHNSFRDHDINKAVVYYDKETCRNDAVERYASEKYGIRFMDADK